MNSNFNQMIIKSYIKMWNKNNKNSFFQKMSETSGSMFLNQSVDKFFIEQSSIKPLLHTKTYLEYKGELAYGTWGIPLLVMSQSYHSNSNIICN